MKELIKKLKEANWVCSDCWDKYWEQPKDHIGTFHEDTCDVCGEVKPVTEPRDYLYFRKTLEWKN